MTNEDNACIRYLMKEMDPSEEVLMERAMMEDDDLLIEVEGMRQTLKRLDKLPLMDPPAYLTDSIIEEAVEYRRKNLNSLLFMSALNFKHAAAAVVVIGATVGGFLFYEDYVPGEPLEETAQQTVTQTVNPVSEETETSQEVEVTPVSDNITAPWIDRNDVIYFRDQHNENNAAFQSLIKSSTEKLTPLNDSFYYNTGSRSLQLTGSGTRQ